MKEGFPKSSLPLESLNVSFLVNDHCLHFDLVSGCNVRESQESRMKKAESYGANSTDKILNKKEEETLLDPYFIT